MQGVFKSPGNTNSKTKVVLEAGTPIFKKERRGYKNFHSFKNPYFLKMFGMKNV